MEKYFCRFVRVNALCCNFLFHILKKLSREENGDLNSSQNLCGSDFSRISKRFNHHSRSALPK